MNGQFGELSTAIEHFFNLQLEGDLDIKGRVSGDSKDAIFESEMSCKACGLKEWFLGDLKSRLKYGDKKLIFNDMLGQFGESRHKTEVLLDFRKNTIDLKSEMPTLSFVDLHKGIERKVNMPVQLTGIGRGKIHLPLIHI